MQVGERLAVKDRMKTLYMDASRAVKQLLSERELFSVIFLDPPYNSNFNQELFQLEGFFRLLADEGLLICENSAHALNLPAVAGMENLFSRKYGETMVNIFSHIHAKQMKSSEAI